MPVTSMNGDRCIRIFLSSTFRDMHGERDHLVKFTFPQLRRLCEARAVTWGEVDLRWGVTEEAAAEGKVLPICFEEIDRCRPYFIGLLGERYGSVPGIIPDDLFDKEKWLREQFEKGKSVTELEILHGVLRNPAAASHAFFYFRDPNYVNSVKEKDRHEFISEGESQQAKLKELKEGIRRSGVPLRENYPTPEALGTLVLADITAVIDDLWPEGSQPDALTREESDHAAFARSRERIYIERPTYFARLDAHAAGGGVQPMVILGESGSGKSALLANWAAQYRRHNSDAFLLEHYIGATPYSAEWATMLRRILGEFKKRFGLTREIPDDLEGLRSAFPNWLHMAGAKSRVILVLDALNQLEDREGAYDLSWLPTVMPENVRLIVSTLPGWALDEITRRGWPVLRVEPLSLAERKELVVKFLADYGRSLSQVRVDRIASAPPAANPLYVRILLNELRVFGRHECLEERISHYLQAASPNELYGKVIRRWEEDYSSDTNLVKDTLSLLWAARRGLSETELLEVLGSDGQPVPRATWSPLFLAMADGLVSRAGLLTFAHDFLRAAVMDAFLPSDSCRDQAHLRLGDYFGGRPSGRRRTDELPWQLAEGQAWEHLCNLLTDRSFLKEAWKQDLFEVATYWTRIEAHSNLRMIDAYRDYIDHPDQQSDYEFLWSLSVLLGAADHAEEALRLHSALAEYFRKKGDWHILQGVLGNKANILERRGNLDAAMALYKEQEQICRQLSNLYGLQLCLGNQALTLRAHGNLDGAMMLLKEQEQLCRQMGNLDGLQRCLLNQGVILDELGNPSEAIALYKEQERICRQLGNLADLQASLGNQAAILLARNNLEQAMALAKEQERICRQLGNLDGLQASIGNQALILLGRGNLDGALTLAKEQERICRQIGNPDRLHRMLDRQAEILIACGDLERAMQFSNEQERICRKLGNPHGLQRALGNQARIMLARGDLDGALRISKEQATICRQLSNLDGLVRSLNIQVTILMAQQDIRRALELAKEQEQVCRRLGDLDGLQASLGNQGNMLDMCGDPDGAIELYKKQEQICREMGNARGLATCLANQAAALANKGCMREALSLAEEAYKLANGHGYQADASRIKIIVDYIRKAAGK